MVDVSLRLQTGASETHLRASRHVRHLALSLAKVKEANEGRPLVTA